jgi:multidrug transporter EmrE-like cation transporter
MVFFTSALAYALLLAVMDVIVLSMLKMRHGSNSSNSNTSPWGWLFDSNWIFVVAFVLYGTQALIFYKSLDYSGLVRSNLLWDLLSDLLVTFFGLYVFSETITSTQGIGVILAIIAIILLK